MNSYGKDPDEKIIALQKKAVSKKIVDKTMIKFSAVKPTKHETKEFPADVQIAVEVARSVASGKELFEASTNLFPHEFESYVNKTLPRSEVIRYAIEAAHFENPPDMASRNARAKQLKNYAVAKAETLARWKDFTASSTPHKTKSFFLDHKIHGIKDVNGKQVSRKTIERWLPKKKTTPLS